MSAENKKSSAPSLILTALICAGLGCGGTALYYNQHYSTSSHEDISAQMNSVAFDSPVLPVAGTPMKGSSDALATVVAFIDFKAPASKSLIESVFDHAITTHQNKVAISYRAYPLRENNDSMQLALAAAAAAHQNKFWEMARELVNFNDKQFTRDAAVQLAAKLGLDVDKFSTDFDSRSIREEIRTDIALGKTLGLTGAPSLFVNTKPIVFNGNVTQDVFMDAVNAEILRMENMIARPGHNYLIASNFNAFLSNLDNAKDRLGRPVKGAPNAIVTIVEYSDYQCPFCARVEPTIARILEDYPDSVRVVFSHNPLPFHKDAKLAAQAAYAAGLQGKFWQMHKILFENQKKLSETDLIKYAGQLQINVEQFKKDLKAQSTVDVIERDLKEAGNRNISGTPNFLINGVVLTGAVPYEKFKTQIDSAIQNARQIQNKTGLIGEDLYAEILRKAPKPEAPKAEAPESRTFVDISGAPFLGNENAPVTIVEFTDFECPFCSRANNTVHELIRNNPDKIKLVFKHNPLAMHKHADAAHRAAEAASLQGKFWEMYDLLFENQKELSDSALNGYAEKIGLNMDKFKADMNSDSVKTRVAADLRQGGSVNVKGTPHFFMNGKRISGAQPLEKFQAMLDAELAVADKYIKRGVAADALYKTIIAEEKPVAEFKKLAPDAPAAPIVLTQGNSYAKGPENAPVVIYQFSEFQCPFCSRVEPTLAELEQLYGDKIRIVFKNFPLPFHKDAKLASEASLAAGEQGKFWEMHDVLFKNQKNLSRAALTEYAKQIGLDVEKFNQALDSHKFLEQVEAEHKEGEKVGITGTPSFVINGQLLKGAQPTEAFKTEIDKALAAIKQ